MHSRWVWFIHYLQSLWGPHNSDRMFCGLQEMRGGETLKGIIAWDNWHVLNNKCLSSSVTYVFSSFVVGWTSLNLDGCIAIVMVVWGKLEGIGAWAINTRVAACCLAHWGHFIVMARKLWFNQGQLDHTVCYCSPTVTDIDRSSNGIILLGITKNILNEQQTDQTLLLHLPGIFYCTLLWAMSKRQMVWDHSDDPKFRTPLGAAQWKEVHSWNSLAYLQWPWLVLCRQ